MGEGTFCLIIFLGTVIVICLGIISGKKASKEATEPVSTEDSPSTVIPKSRQKQHEQSSGVTPVPTVTSVAKTVGSFDLLNRLPLAFYLLAIIGGFIGLASMLMAKELSGAEAGAMFGFIIGASLSIIAVGRIIEVLQQIRDK